MKSVVLNGSTILIMNIKQVGLTDSKNMWMMLFYNMIYVSPFIDEKGTPFISMANLDPFTASFPIGIPWLEVGDHSEEEVRHNIDTTEEDCYSRG